MSSMYGYAGSTPNVAKVSGTGFNQLTMGADPRTVRLWEKLMNGVAPGLDQGLGQLSQLAGGGNEESWRQLEAPAMREFDQLQGSVASRFSGIGSGARHSSGFQNTMNSAGVDLAERLQSQRMNLQQQAIRDLLGISQSLLGTSLSDNVLIPRKKPFWQELLGGVAPGVGQAFGSLPSLAFM